MPKQYTTKFDILRFIDENEIIGPSDLVDWFPMKYHSAVERLRRLKKAGLVEPLGSERGKWVLSLEGYKLLDYLRRRRDGK